MNNFLVLKTNLVTIIFTRLSFTYKSHNVSFLMLVFMRLQLNKLWPTFFV